MDPDRRDEIPIGPDLTALERRLSGWRPAAGALDRDRILYDAGRAAAEGRGRPWRLATGALLLVSMGLGGALIHQRSELAREGALLASERTRRLELETALAVRSAPSPVPQGTIEPPAPSSYLALSARLGEEWDIASPPGVAAESEPRRPAPAPSDAEWHPIPLRPQDIRRVLDL